MKNKKIIAALLVVGLLAAGGAGLYHLGKRQGVQNASGTAAPSGGASPAGAQEKKPLYWHDPMVPGPRFDKPGKSPFMDMDLVPVYADDAGDEGTVSISPRVQQNLGIRTAEVTRGSLASALTAVGSVAFNERDVHLVQARSDGFVERLHVRAPLDPVKRGQPLADLYVPDWIAAQEEYLSARRMQGAGIEGLVAASRQRMRLAGMSERQIQAVVASGKVQPRVTIVAPASGVVTELSAREGMTVMNGAPLYRINGLRTVWVNAEIPESAAGVVRPGSPVRARTAALPGTVLTGEVGAILPEVDQATRTLKARIELANPLGKLIPGMFVTLDLAPKARADVLLVPSEAVIQTGRRTVVMVAEGNGKFSPAEVEIGAESDGKTEIISGLSAGQKVVVSGQFLVDSEASLKGTAMRMGEAQGPAKDAPEASDVHRAEGTVEAIEGDEITLSHGPIPSLDWGPMTMPFKAPPAGLPPGVKVGQKVKFAFRALEDGVYQITDIAVMAEAPAKTPGAARMSMPGRMDMPAMATGGGR